MNERSFYDGRSERATATVPAYHGGVSVALLHPGEMGAAIGAALVEAGNQVHWASAGRSKAIQGRASGRRRRCRDIAEAQQPCDLRLSSPCGTRCRY